MLFSDKKMPALRIAVIQPVTQAACKEGLQDLPSGSALPHKASPYRPLALMAFLSTGAEKIISVFLIKKSEKRN